MLEWLVWKFVEMAWGGDLLSYMVLFGTFAAITLAVDKVKRARLSRAASRQLVTESQSPACHPSLSPHSPHSGTAIDTKVPAGSVPK
jgi:hypothetical protein